MQVTQVRGRLSGLLTHHQQLWVDQSERVDHDLALDRLNRIHDHGHSARVERLEALLRVDVDTGQPAAEARVAVVPPYHHLVAGAR